jgi:hypothetical protein
MERTPPKEIREQASKLEFVLALYGMGSFFHGTIYKDLDLVAVIECSQNELPNRAAQVHREFRELSVKLGISVDLTVLTPSEFASAPLRDMATLVKLYERGSLLRFLECSPLCGSGLEIEHSKETVQTSPLDALDEFTP